MTEVEDEDSWLYGDSTKVKSEPEAPSSSVLSEKEPVKSAENIPEANKTGDSQGVVENGKETEKDATPTTTKSEAKNDEDDDDSDDDVQVTIGEITTGGTPGSFPTQGLRTFYRNPVPVPQKLTLTKGLDMEAPGDINGKPVLETNIDLLDEKPWRKPGADISDYFNFGFNENTWKQYCDKQKKFRGQVDHTPVITLPLPKPAQNGVTLFSTPPYIPINKFENTVRTISTLQFSRRKEDELLAAALASSAAANAVQTPASASLAPPMGIPRPVTTQVFLPSIRPPVSGTLPSTPLPFPPINPNQPPPNVPIGVPPPGFLMPGCPPPGMPPPGVVPPPEYLQSAAMAFPPGFQAPMAHAAPPPFYNHQEGGSDPHFRQFPDRRPSDSEADRNSEDDGRYRREQGSSSSRRDYDRDRYSRRDYRDGRPRERERDRDRDRDRDREKDRDRDRDRDREKDRGERDKDRDRERERSQRESSTSGRRHREESPSRHKSLRRKHEDDERHSSKHKKAKKHKHKDRDSDAPPGTDEAPGNDEQAK